MYLEEKVMLQMLAPDLVLEVDQALVLAAEAEAEVGQALVLAAEAEAEVGQEQITDNKRVTTYVTLRLEFAFKQIYFGAKHHNWCFAVFESHFYATKKIPILQTSRFT